MNMNERPLWIDISEWQGEFDFTKMDTDNRVSGVVSRAGVGNRVDPQFVRNYSQSKKADKYRTSYWAIDPIQIIQPQIDKWIDIHPILDRIPRMLDAELNGTDPRDTGMDIQEVSDYIATYDNVEPWLYFGRYFAMDNVIPYVTYDWLNQHWIMMAQYDMGDGKEYEGVIIPDGIDPDRVIFKQTTDKMKLYSGGPVIDRDRFLLGGLAEMYTFMNSQLDTVEPPIEPPVDPPVDCCEDIWNKIEEIKADITGLQEDDLLPYLAINANASEIEKLQANDRVDGELIAQLGYVQNIQDAEITKLKEDLSFQAQEIEDNRANLQKQIDELKETNWKLIMDVTKLKEDMNNTPSLDDINFLKERVQSQLDGLNKRLNELKLQNNHTHWWKGLFK